MLSSESRSESINRFTRLIEVAQAMRLRPIICPDNIHELQLGNLSEQYRFTTSPRLQSCEKAADCYGWRFRKSSLKEEYVDIEFTSSQPLSIKSCCSCNDPGEFKIDLISSRSEDISLVAHPFDVSCLNVGHLIPVDWGIIDSSYSLVARVWAAKSDRAFLFAIFGEQFTLTRDGCQFSA